MVCRIAESNTVVEVQAALETIACGSQPLRVTVTACTRPRAAVPVGYLLSAEINHSGRVVLGGFRFSRPSEGTPFPTALHVPKPKRDTVEPDEAFRNKAVDKHPYVIHSFIGLWHIVKIMGHLLEESIECMFPVEEFPEVDPRGTQAEPPAGVWIKQDGPVVKLLPKDDVGVGYGFVAVFQGGTLRISSAMQPTCQDARQAALPAIMVRLYEETNIQR